MIIHHEHPFLPPEGERDPVRRLRGRMPAPITVWATGRGADRVGLTVSSLLVADGDPSRVVGLIDPDSELGEAIADGAERVAVSLLADGHQFLAEAFAGQAPSPGGPFRQGSWTDSGWGPVLEGAAGWLGARLETDPARRVGWGMYVEGVVEHAEVGAVEALVHVRGRARVWPPR